MFNNTVSPGVSSLLILTGTPRAKETMKTLIAKFPEGYEGWALERGETPVQRVHSETSYAFLQKGTGIANNPD